MIRVKRSLSFFLFLLSLFTGSVIFEKTTTSCQHVISDNRSVSVYDAKDDIFVFSAQQATFAREEPTQTNLIQLLQLSFVKELQSIEFSKEKQPVFLNEEQSADRPFRIPCSDRFMQSGSSSISSRKYLERYYIFGLQKIVV